MLGTLLAVGIHRYTRGGLLRAFAIAPALLPDLLLAIGLLSLFSLLGDDPRAALGHASRTSTFAHGVRHRDRAGPAGQPRPVPRGGLARPRRRRGAHVLRVTLPAARPGIVAGALLAFTLSLDEFVIAFFTDGPDHPDPADRIYSMVRFGVTPEINALATMLLFVSVLAVIGAQRLTRVTDAL